MCHRCTVLVTLWTSTRTNRQAAPLALRTAPLPCPYTCRACNRAHWGRSTHPCTASSCLHTPMAAASSQRTRPPRCGCHRSGSDCLGQSLQRFGAHQSTARHNSHESPATAQEIRADGASSALRPCLARGCSTNMPYRSSHGIHAWHLP